MTKHTSILASVAMLLLAPAAGGFAAAAEPAEGTLRPHPPILIQSDAGFLLPTSGVVGGSGTPEDPYVIAGWLIPTTQTASVDIRNTTAHVVVQDVASAPGSIFFSGAHVLGASNVTLRRVAFEGTHNNGILVQDSKDVTIDGAVLTKGPNGDGLFPPFAGLSILRSERVHVRGVLASGGDVPLRMTMVRDAAFEESTFANGVASGGIGHLENVTFRGVTFDGFDLTFQGANRDIAFLDGAILGRAQLAMLRSSPTTMDGLLVCGSTFSSSDPDSALVVQYAQDVVVIGNDFVDNARNGARLVESSVRLEKNLFERNAFGPQLGYPVTAGAHALVARDNAFLVGTIYATPGVDLVANWWGDASGPSGDATGTGSGLSFRYATAPYEPWLTSPPDRAVDCEAELALRRA